MCAIKVKISAVVANKTQRGPRIQYFRLHFVILGLAILAISPFDAKADVPVIPSDQTFECTPTHVWDGDGPIWCEEGPRLRLAGIAAREIDGTCSPGHPCPQASAEDARAALVALLGTPTGVTRHGHIMVTGPTLKCRSDGSAGGNRTASWCVSPRTGDINCTMVNSGWAARWDQYWNNHSC